MMLNEVELEMVCQLVIQYINTMDHEMALLWKAEDDENSNKSFAMLVESRKQYSDLLARIDG